MKRSMVRQLERNNKFSEDNILLLWNVEQQRCAMAIIFLGFIFMPTAIEILELRIRSMV